MKVLLQALQHAVLRGILIVGVTFFPLLLSKRKANSYHFKGNDTLMNELVKKLIQLSGQAEHTFTASTQGCSACQLQKLGQLSSQVKYSEGRDYVARQILKIARIDEPQLGEITLNLNQLEAKHRGIKESLVLTSPDWQAYADGALSMVEEIRMLLPEN